IAKVRRGLKPPPHSKSPLKRTINHSFSRLQTTSAMRQGFQPLADWRTGGLADWRTGGLADWRTGGLAD
ncbi:hypothetical protein QUB56_01820, partial [Microcoleus sp. AR_TQ3_B6]|uniref:hypothetical protein n=1 Tax=Microcoleus sp. AR_TQ3_B6 TaxID=3055284 RepID=UPI002FD278BD